MTSDRRASRFGQLRKGRPRLLILPLLLILLSSHKARRCLQRSAIAGGRRMRRSSPRCATSKQYEACPPFGRRLNVHREGDILFGLQPEPPFASKWNGGF